MKVEELSGRPHNRDCLHCVLPPVIEAFANAHPDRPGPHLVGDIATVLGELIASGAFEAGNVTPTEQLMTLRLVLRFATDHLHQSAHAMFAELQRRTVKP